MKKRKTNFYTTAEAAIVLKLKPKTIAIYIKRGLIIAEKKGRDYLIEYSEVERFQKERRKAGRPFHE